jgi:uncharacterized membrane protein YhhN
MITTLIIMVCAAATAGLILVDTRQSLLGRWLTKPLASAAFVALGLQQGALESSYGVTVLAALLLCMLGDILLIPDSVGPVFLGGLASFLLGHVAFALAFLLMGVSWPVVATAAAVLVLPSLAVLWWLRPHLEGPMRLAVPAYILAIVTMVALSMGAGIPNAHWLIPAGTVCFFLSDISVARDRFVAPGWINRVWGLPLYYGATVLLALTV